VSPDLQVALNPETSYRRLVAEGGEPSWLRVAARLAVLTLTFAVIVPIMATHAVTMSLVGLSALAWCFVPIVQTALALVTVGPARGRTMSLARAFELWFAGHLPYTAWILLLPILTRLGDFLQIDFIVVVTFAAAVVWASFIETAYCRVVLNASPSAARARVSAHQALMLVIVAGGVVWASSAGGIASFLANAAARIRS
jgi:hypothetical protein